MLLDKLWFVCFSHEAPPTIVGGAEKLIVTV